MSDTPRMDAVQWLAEDGAGGTHSVVSLADARKLELELNAANQRIKRLEEAGDLLAQRAAQLGLLPMAIEGWNQAKEEKP